MTTKHSADELTHAEILQLLRNKLRSKYGHQERLQNYRQTGRAITLSCDLKNEKDSSNISSFELPSQSHSKNLPRFSGSHIIGRALHFFEIATVFGLLVLFGYGSNALFNLNRISASGQILPTLTPTPIIQAFILPEGHTPPNSPGGARPNIEEEIPPHLRPLVNNFVNIPTPTAAPNQGVRIQIPALKIDSPIVQGDGWEQLKKGVAQHIGSANPGEKGNMVLSGHNDVFGEVFRYLDLLKPGDQIIIFTFDRSFTYIVTGWTLVEPDQVEVMNPTPDETVTLISCYPYLIDKQRIIVKASLLRN